MSPHLEFDIQLEIIQRLTVKLLIRFRSVCKAWKLFIDSSYFIASYNGPHDHLLIRYEVGYMEENEAKYVCFVDDNFPQQMFALTIPHLVQRTRILGSSHGLLALTGYYRESEELMQRAVIWNPAIRKSIAIVVPNPVHKPFDSVLGFGVCPDTKDPKLVKITFIEELWKMESISSIPCQVMIFTLSSGKWTTSSCNNPPRKSIEFSDDFQTNIGQFIYWLVSDWVAEYGEYRNLIMSFDMSTQEFREIELPDSLAEPHEPELFVSRLRESLALVECNYVTDLSKDVCVVWIMDDGDFTKLFTINPPNASVWSTLGFRKSGEPIVKILKVKDNRDYETQPVLVETLEDNRGYERQPVLVVYDPFSKQIKDLGISGPKHSFYGSSYTESLLLLDHDDGHILRCEDMTLGTG